MSATLVPMPIVVIAARLPRERSFGDTARPGAGVAFERSTGARS